MLKAIWCWEYDGSQGREGQWRSSKAACPNLDVRLYVRRDQADPKWHLFNDEGNPPPMDGTPILACNKDPAAQNPVVIYYEAGSVAFNIPPHWRTSTHDVFTVSLVTHWTPLPILPTQNTPKQKADT